MFIANLGSLVFFIEVFLDCPALTKEVPQEPEADSCDGKLALVREQSSVRNNDPSPIFI